MAGVRRQVTEGGRGLCVEIEGVIRKVAGRRSRVAGGVGMGFVVVEGIRDRELVEGNFGTDWGNLTTDFRGLARTFLGEGGEQGNFSHGFHGWV